jgi:hypothetical protein
MTPAGEPSLGLLAQKLQRRQAGRSLAMTKKSGKTEKPLTRSGDVIYSIPTIAQKVKPSKMSKIAGTVKIKERNGGVYPRLILGSLPWD